MCTPKLMVVGGIVDKAKNTDDVAKNLVKAATREVGEVVSKAKNEITKIVNEAKDEVTKITRVLDALENFWNKAKWWLLVLGCVCCLAVTGPFLWPLLMGLSAARSAVSTAVSMTGLNAPPNMAR